MFATNLHLQVISTVTAEHGRVIAVNEFGSEVIILGDGVNFDGIDIDDIYSEDGDEWERLVQGRIDDYAADFHFQALLGQDGRALIRTSDGQIDYELV